MSVFYWGIEEEPERTFVIKAPKAIKEPKQSKSRLSKDQILLYKRTLLMIEAEADMAEWIAEMEQIYLDRHESLVRLMQAPSGAGDRCKRRTSESELDIDATALKQHSEAYLGGINY